MNLPLAALFGLWLVSAPSAQDGRGEVLGLVRTESGRSVADAVIRFFPDGDRGYSWQPPPGPLPEAVEGRSGPDGRFRFPAPAGSGCLVVEHPSGVGAVLSRVTSGAPVPVVVRALGSVTLRGGGDFRAAVRFPRSGQESAWLGHDSGNELRLPAGRFLLWIAVGDARTEHLVMIRPGARTELEPSGGRGPVVPASDAKRVELGRWPGLEARGADGRLPVLAAPDALRSVFEPLPGLRVFAEGWVDGDGVVRVAAPVGRTTEVTVRDEDGVPLSDAEVFTIADAPGGPRVLGRARAEDGSVAVWLPDAEQTTHARRLVVVATAPGRRPALVDADALGPDLRLATARPAQLRVQGAGGEPVGGASVLVRSPRDPLLDRDLDADDRGVVRIPDAPADGFDVRVRHPEHLSKDARVDSGGGDSLPVVTLEPGLRINGVVRRKPDGAAGGVEVELRDPTATLGIDTRTVITAADGTFRFAGLPDGTYTLFAHTVDDGVTWSGKLRGVQPGRDVWLLEIVNEDPLPPGGRRDGRR